MTRAERAHNPGHLQTCWSSPITHALAPTLMCGHLVQGG